jgi:hypothetical protein
MQGLKDARRDCGPNLIEITTIVHPSPPVSVTISMVAAESSCVHYQRLASTGVGAVLRVASMCLIY